MIIAQFYLGPFDGRRLILPTTEPWPRFVIPRWDLPIEIEAFYLYSGRLEDLHTYIFDDEYSTVLDTKNV